MQRFYRSIWSSWQTSAESWIGSMRKCHAVIGAKILTSKVGGVFPTGIAVYWAIFVCVCLNFAAAKLSGRSFSNQDASWSKSNPGRIEKEMLSKFSNTLFQDEVCSCFSWILPTCQCAGSFSLFQSSQILSLPGDQPRIPSSCLVPSCAILCLKEPCESAMLHLVLAVAGGPWMGVWTRQPDETQTRQQTAQVRKESQQNHETLPSPWTGCKENATKKHKFQPDQGTSVGFSLEPSMRRHWTPSSFRCSRRNCSSCGCSDSPRSRRSTSRAVRNAEKASREWHGNVTPREDRNETWPPSGAPCDPCGGRWVTRALVKGWLWWSWATCGILWPRSFIWRQLKVLVPRLAGHTLRKETVQVFDLIIQGSTGTKDATNARKFSSVRWDMDLLVCRCVCDWFLRSGDRMSPYESCSIAPDTKMETKH